MRDKAYQLLPLLTDRNAISQCDTEIRECQKYIDYFTEELAKVESRDLHSTESMETISNDIPPRSTNTGPHGDIKKYSTLGKYPASTMKMKVAYDLNNRLAHDRNFV
jgi:hypothetical protein